MTVLPAPGHPRFRSLVRRIEAMRVEGAFRHWARIPHDLARAARPRVERVGDGLLTLMETSDALQINRVIGLGHRGEADQRIIDRILERFRSARRRRFTIQLGAGPQSERIAGWLLARGFKPHGGLTLLLRDCRLPVPRPPAGVRVRRVGPACRETLVEIMSEAFAIPASRRGWSLAAASAPEYDHFLGLVGNAPAGVGALCVKGMLAWLGGGATRTRWRRRGVHAALIAARLRRAATLGSRWAWVETMEPRKGRPDGSRRNLLRLGFVEAGVSRTFLWQAQR